MTSAPSSTRVVIVAALGEGGLGLLALGLGWLLERPPAATIAWRWPDVGSGLLATLPLLAVLLLVVHAPLRAFVRLNRLVEHTILPLFEDCTWLDFATLSLLAGICEELLFRGLLQRGLSDWTSPWIGWLVASVLFGLAHAVTPGYAVFAGLLGCYLGALFLFSGNLLVAIVAHAAYDFLALAYLVRRHDTRHSRA